MIIDCGMCDMRGTRVCDDCVVSAFVEDNGILELAEAEQAAIDSMSKIGLVPPIRLVHNNEASNQASSASGP